MSISSVTSSEFRDGIYEERKFSMTDESCCIEQISININTYKILIIKYLFTWFRDEDCLNHNCRYLRLLYNIDCFIIIFLIHIIVNEHVY